MSFDIGVFLIVTIVFVSVATLFEMWHWYRKATIVNSIVKISHIKDVRKIVGKIGWFDFRHAHKIVDRWLEANEMRFSTYAQWVSAIKIVESSKGRKC